MISDILTLNGLSEHPTIVYPNNLALNSKCTCKGVYLINGFDEKAFGVHVMYRLKVGILSARLYVTRLH